MSGSEATDDGLAVAIVGMAGRFPGAASVEELWELLIDGRSGVVAVDREPLADERVPVWAGIDEADGFDADFFGVSPREAILLDPQHRAFLECAWHAFEDAELDPGASEHEVGVFASAGINLYLIDNLAPNALVRSAAGGLQLAIAGDKDSLATRVSYKLNLTGPSVTVQANCSSSALAVHLAASSLLDGECDIALAGGSSIKAPHPRGYVHEPGGPTSPDGTCWPFDASAHGHVIGDAVAAVVLRRLDDALVAGDRIHAVIRGSAVTNDGGHKVSFVSPGRNGQIRAIKKGLRAAAVASSSLQYIEANGTATPMGDAIEISALREALGTDPPPAGHWLVGSIKPNVGNVDAAAGVTAVIKAALAVREGVVPPTIGKETPHPQLQLEQISFAVANRVQAWPSTGGSRRRAGVNCFGVGGTNVHLVIEAPPEPPPSVRSDPLARPCLVVVSARSEAALGRLVGDHRERLSQDPDLIAWSEASRRGRRAFAWRTYAVGRNGAEVAARLAQQPRRAVSALGSRYALVIADGAVAPTPNREHQAWIEAHGACRAAAVEPELATRFADAVSGARSVTDLLGEPTVVGGAGTGALIAAVIAGALDLCEAARRLTRPSALLAALNEDGVTCPWVVLERDADGCGPGGEKLLGLAPDVVLEYGAPQLIPVLQAADAHSDRRYVATADGDDVEAAFLRAIGEAWAAGCNVVWERLPGAQLARRADLPRYPFERTSFWIEPPTTDGARVDSDADGAPTAAGAVVGGSSVSLPEDFSPLERIIADLWCRHLGRSTVQRTDSFLELGGDSLLAARMLTSLAEIFPIELDLGMFIETPTVPDQAAVLRAALDDMVASIDAAREVLDALGAEDLAVGIGADDAVPGGFV